MSTSVQFIGSGFALESVSSTTPGTIRVRYTVDPRQSDPTHPNDGRNPANYTLSGPTASPLITSIVTVSGDPQSLDILLAAPLTAGTWVLSAVNVQTPAGSVLGSPSSLNFTVNATGNVTSLSGGAENDDPESIIRKHLSPAMAGENWDALIAALGTGDDGNWKNAALAFDQLFKSTASAKYLDRKSANDGFSRPAGIGMADDLFRELSIKITNNKVVHQALREILRVFYGRDALQAYAETELAEPFLLGEGQTLEWTLDEDERQVFTHIFSGYQFRSLSVATAVEVAAALTKTMRDRGSQGFAAVSTDTETGGKKVRIYSASLGLKSFVRVTGGDAQPFLEFPQHRDIYSGTVNSGLGYNWVYSRPAPNITRLTLATIGQPLIDVSSIEEGDYVIVGEDAQSVPGVYRVRAVSFSWVSTTLTQIIDLDSDLLFTGSALQLSNSAYTYFSPQKQTILTGDRTVVVAQTVNKQVDIQIPATTQAVNRTARTGAYGRLNADKAIVHYVRDGAGVATLETSAAHGFSVGDQVLIEGIAPARGRPWISPGTPGTYPAVGSTDAGYGSGFSGTQNTPGQATDSFKGTILGSGDLLVVGGGYAAIGGSYAGETLECNRLHYTGTLPVIDGSEADGALRKTYQWLATANTPVGRLSHGLSTLIDGRALVTAGMNNVLTTPTFLATAAVYSESGDSWTATPPMTLARAGHQQVTLNDGRVLVIGGAWNFGTATPTVEIYNPATATWSVGNPMSVPRFGHQAVKLRDGRVMVIGGATLGVETGTDSNTLAYWKFDEASGPNAADSSGNGYGLTDSGGSLVANGKIKLCRDFVTPGSYMTAPGNAGAVTALLGEWTIEFWLPDGAGDGVNFLTIAAYMGVNETAANNMLLHVGVDPFSRIWWKWENGAGVDVMQTQTLGAVVQFANTHVALRKTLNGGNYDVDLFINGVLTESWLAQPNATGGSTASWYIGVNGESGSQGFAKKIDDLRISKVARSDNEIHLTYLKGAGRMEIPPNSTFLGGQLLNSTEFFDPNTSTWSRGPDMELLRTYHGAAVLADGRVLVTGGTARDPVAPLPTPLEIWAPNFWPNQSTNTMEIFDPDENRWYSAGKMSVNRSNGQTVYLPGSDTVWITGGLGYVLDFTSPTFSGTFADTSAVELFSPRTGKTSLTPMPIYGSRFVSTFAGNDTVLLGGGTNNIDFASLENYDLWISGANAISGGGLNGFHAITGVPSSTRFQVTTPEHRTYVSNFGPSSAGIIGLNVDAATPQYNLYVSGSPNFVVSTSATRVANTVTLTVSAHGFSVGDLAFANNNHNSFPNGIKTITATTPTSLSYSEAGANVGATSINGTVATNYNDTGSVTSISATAQPSNDPGPYIFDPDSGLSLLPGTTSATVTGAYVSGAIVPVRAGGSYPALYLSSTAGIPTGPGYLVLDFGGPNQSLPLRYIEVVDANIVLIDFAFSFQANYANPTVAVIRDRSPFVPALPSDSANFYVTGSSAGRVAAEATVREASAAGILVNVNVVYPGDRGLGGEGYPTSGEDKLTDAIRVWGGDELDELE